MQPEYAQLLAELTVEVGAWLVHAARKLDELYATGDEEAFVALLARYERAVDRGRVLGVVPNVFWPEPGNQPQTSPSGGVAV